MRTPVKAQVWALAPVAALALTALAISLGPAPVTAKTPTIRMSLTI